MSSIPQCVGNLLAVVTAIVAVAVRPPADAAQISYALPYDGKETTYRVTLAAAPADNPDWLVSTFVAGAVRTATAQNRGCFTESWDGLDDNFMPVPLGNYVVKGIFCPAEIWPIDGQTHSLIAQYVCSPGDSWASSPGEDHRFPALHGHVFEPIYEVVPAPDGTALALGGYVENGYNPFLIDLNKPVGMDQVIKCFPSHGRAGGQLAAYVGCHAWMARRNEVYSPTNPKFGTEENRYGHGFSRVNPDPSQPPTDLTAVRRDNRTRLLLCEPAANRLSVMEGDTGRMLYAVSLPGVRATSVHPGTGACLALCRDEAGWHLRMSTDDAETPWTLACRLPRGVRDPRDLAIDHRGRFYLTDGRVIRKVGPDGVLLATFGKDQKLRGTWDPEVMIGLNRIHVWRDTGGRSRLLATTSGAPQRTVEWDADTGAVIRDWLLAQNAAGGFCMDPEQPSHVYTTALIGAQLIRYAVDYETGAWRVDAIWEDLCYPNMETHFPGGRLFPQILHHDGRKYLCFGGGAFRSRGGWMIYRYLPDKDDWIPAAAVVDKRWWHDESGDVAKPPPHALRLRK